MTEQEKVMQDMERVAFPIYKPNSKDIMVLGALYDAGYRKEEEVRKETAREILQTLCNNLKYPQYFQVYIETLAQKFGVEVEEYASKKS